MRTGRVWPVKPPMRKEPGRSTLDGRNHVVAGMPTKCLKLRNAPHMFQNIASFASANCQEMMNNADYGTVTSPPVGLMP